MTETGSWLSDVTFWVDGKASSPATGGGGSGGADTGGGGGGGFSLTRDEAESLLRECRGILDDLRACEERAAGLTRMGPPAQDPASVALNKAFVGDGSDPGAFGYGHGHIKKEIAYLEELIDRLRRALNDIDDADDVAARQVGRAGGNSEEGYIQ
ncbi:hypothetical protein SAMN05421810_101607 [Amycolatopsis arida]|uniref:PE family protein n=1 Tax=Amycolatopsis arida TaxID=587909 RepID=A0A1I5LQ05_9PSEU|nr:hypothetical protein [Amycolatopsis arida]TDX93784.1 hypothetical protein CLV69_104240 [Amycolatopsis arida]SFO98851.1 hypothetical protein SAMN05421810_101607 [Amycolatopsis arida]